MRMRRRLGLDSASLRTSSGVLKAREGLESAICLAILQGLLRGLAVVMMAPNDMTKRQTTGK
ncbi:hypothetical protein Tsubulata_029438 [Turnera subulata]|uniref:Uncharacterized protein n=1 Tax=Turnera subulata TaxID=218843 RepID=A0A9Q0F2K6_9ROSI|nr:hypothetical protein Tsubulata_029438 [Turnera subulata]